MSGPLHDLSVLSFANIGAAPFCAMLLADLGADVIRVEPPVKSAAQDVVPIAGSPYDVLARGQRSIALNLKETWGRDAAKMLVAQADVLLEGYRPGTMERLGLGPEPCLEQNPKLIYGRMTGWGQAGPLASKAGHDINYIALSGALDAIGHAGGPPTVPLNLIGDYGGGGMLLALGVLSALWERQHSGRGQVVDAAMADGAALLMSSLYGMHAGGVLPGGRGENFIDGGAPFYGVYECGDGRFVAVGALEPVFWGNLVRALGLEEARMREGQFDRNAWPEMRARVAAAFVRKPQHEWLSLFEDMDVCVTPVLGYDEAPLHPQNIARGTFLDIGGVVQPAPEPRFARTPAGMPGAPPSRVGVDTESVLREAAIPGDIVRAVLQERC